MDQLCEQRLAAFNGLAGKCPSGDQHWRALGGTVKRSTQTGALQLLFGSSRLNRSKRSANRGFGAITFGDKEAPGFFILIQATPEIGGCCELNI